MALWEPHLAGSLVAIGNAPTSLFRLLEMIAEGAAAPAAVIGTPVGFVGAAELKALLAAEGCVPFLIVRGRKGGSAMAVAAINALSSENRMSALDAIMGRAKAGMIHGIGVGPGDASLMTLRAAGLIRTVDTLAYFAKAGNESNARRIAAPLIEAGRKEMPLHYPVTTELSVADPGIQATDPRLLCGGGGGDRRTPARRRVCRPSG